MARKIIIHAGQHKTGSTSIQSYLENNLDFLASHGIAVLGDWTRDLARPRHTKLPCNAKFVANAIVRNSLDIPIRINGSCAALPETAKREGLKRINAHLRGMAQDSVVVSAEALAFIREPGELALIDLLCDGMDWRAIMFLREPGAWMASWKIQIANSMVRHRQGISPESGIFDFSANSWLTDHQAIRALWGNRCAFQGYEAALLAHGSVIPAFLAELGLDPQTCPDWNPFFLNTSAAKPARPAGR